MKPRRLPKYRIQKDKKGDRAFVELSGKRFYLGEPNSPESLEAYHRLIAEWLASGRSLTVPQEKLTIAELLARFWTFAEEYYTRPDGTHSSELRDYRIALRPLHELYGRTAVSDFGPRALRAIRVSLIDRGLSRRYINHQIRRIKRVFKWGMVEELVDPAVAQRVQALEGLKRGRSRAREAAPVRPVPLEHVHAIRPHVTRQVWALIELQIFTAARPGELAAMRPCDLDTSGRIWTYSPPEHKTAYHEHSRTIYLGPRAQEIARPFLVRPHRSCMFSPREAMEETRAARRDRRKTPLSCGNRTGTNRKRAPRKWPGDRYTTASYGRAIAKACQKAGVPHWHPHQLRHSAATLLRKEFGLEVARIILGHRSPAITEVYAELDREKALRVMEEIG